jgi:MFS family permease
VTSPLQSPRVRRIVAGYTVNRLGNWVGYVAISLAVYDHTGSALAVSGVLMAAQALPAFLVPWVVARIETFHRRGVLAALYFFEAVTTAAIAVLVSNFSLPALLVLAAIDGVAGLAASALLRSELARAAREHVEANWPVDAPAHVSASQAAAPGEPVLEQTRDEAIHEAERKANAALNIAFSVSFVLGPTLGGVIVAAAGAPTALLLDVATFAVCGALLLDLDPHVPEDETTSVTARLQAAWRHINEAPALRSLLIVEAIALVFAESAGPIEVAFAKSTLKVGDGGFGLLVGMWGAGAVLGSLVFARSLKRPLGVLLSTGTLAVGLSYVGFAVAPALWFACGAALVGGIGNGVELPSLTSIVQRITPKALHGRMMGAVESIVALCVAAGLPLGGALVALSTPRDAFAIVGLGAAATTPLLLRLSMRGTAAADKQKHDPPRSVSPAPQ